MDNKKQEVVALEKKKLKSVDLELLHIRYIPLNHPEHLWPDNNEPMKLVTSPHVDLMRLFYKHGWDWNLIRETNYYKERKYRGEIGMRNWDSEDYIKKHIKRRYSIFKSVKENGLSFKKRGSKPIAVLGVPFWTSRFGLRHYWLRGPEIWDGAGVCSAAYVLGYKKVRALWVKDAFPGTRSCEKITNKFKNLRPLEVQNVNSN